MKKLILISAMLMLLASSCQKEEKERLAQLQEELAALEQGAAPSVPGSGDPVQAPEGEYAFSFDKEFYGVDAGSSATIEYTLPEASTVEIVVKDGWTATVAENGTTGTITVTAADPAHPTELLATATSATGRRTATVLPIMVRDPYTSSTRPRLEALGYYCFKPWNATLENYQKLADAGLTMVTLETDEGDWKSYIDIAAQAGLKTLAVVGNQGEYWYHHMEDTAFEEVVSYLKDCPSVYGYHMCDEPSVDEIWRLMAEKDRIRSIDPIRPIYINLLANASSGSLGVNSYPEYVSIMADYMNFEFISFDIYPILVGAIQTDWYYCLRTVSDEARKHGIPFWAFAASCWINLETTTTLKREKPTTNNILLQVYTNLAYGAQGVEYFTIQDYGGTNYAPIMRDGTWTQAYEELKTANLTMQKRAFVFSGSEVTKIRQTGPLAPNESYLSKTDLPPEISSMEVTLGTTVSFLENKGNAYIAVVNNYWTADQVVKIEVNSPVYLIDKDARFQLLEPGAQSLWLSMGDMLVLKYK